MSAVRLLLRLGRRLRALEAVGGRRPVVVRVIDVRHAKIVKSCWVARVLVVCRSSKMVRVLERMFVRLRENPGDNTTVARVNLMKSRSVGYEWLRRRKGEPRGRAQYWRVLRYGVGWTWSLMRGWGGRNRV